MVQTPLNSKQQAQSTSEKDVQQLYECFSDLGRLQQGANLDISPPCILVVGHQTDGKSGEPLSSSIIAQIYILSYVLKCLR